jgi:RNA polymerase sigma-70 factor (ECF subfamily)
MKTNFSNNFNVDGIPFCERNESWMGTDSEKNRLFVQLFLKSQRRIYGYVMATVANPTEADDIVQEIATLLWRKFDAYTPGTNFTAWALATARFKVLRYLREKSYKRRFSAETLEAIEDIHFGNMDQEETAVELLRECMERLGKEDRRILSMRYEEEMTLQRLAAQLGLTVDSVFRQISRIHIVLLNCVRRSALE